MALLEKYDALPAEDIKAALRPLLMVATSPAFGAVSKRELELAVFEMFRELGVIERKASLFSLMTELRVTRAKASQLLFDIEVRSRGSDTDALDEEIRLALAETKFLKDGDLFVLEIENPLVQAHLRNRLRELGHVSDTSFNSAIVRMSLDAATDLTVELIPADRREAVKNALVAAGAPDGSVKGVLKGALKTLGKKFAGEAGDQLAEGAVDKAEAFVLPLFAMAGRGVTDVWTGLWNRPAADAQG
ncbi:hypothetical protein [Brevundimonas vesicularis]|uniref:hypothetical protein n=1 Tax=Brevundimonas vesicularis TaxID=41276 RepID=UPI0022AC2446|nr:hypothetical protein [Brevundimonas vesicularis]